jgi:hypothetical protein
MPDCVLDTTVIAFANGDINGRKPGNKLDKRLSVIEKVGSGHWRIRYNSKLLAEYGAHVTVRRNDVIELFFAVLESSRSVFVRRSTLPSHSYEIAAKKCRWPAHDQHLLAASLDGDSPSLFVTDKALVRCAALVFKHFDIRVRDLA